MSTILFRSGNTCLLFLWCIIILGCESKHEKQVKTYEQVHNRHDVDKVMSLYSNDISFEIVGTWVKSGKGQVHGLAEWDSVTNSSMLISDIVVHADTASFKLKEGNDWFRLVGIEFMYYERCRMVFKNGLIEKIKAEVSDESIEAFQEIWPSVIQWLTEERNKEIYELMPNGEFVYNAENATKWLSLLNEWQEKTNHIK